MTLGTDQILLGMAGLNALAAVALGLRALHSRAGTWAMVLGLLLALAALGLGLVVQGHERLLPLWWFSWSLLPVLFLPLAVAVANVGLLRQLLLFFNLCLGILAAGLSYWLFTQLQRHPAGSAAVVQLPSQAVYLFGWAGALWLMALLDTLLQWLRCHKPADRQRQLIFLLVLLGLGLGLGLDAYAYLGGPVAPWGIAIASAAYLLLVVQLMLRPGPRRISGTVTPAILQSSHQPLLIADGDGRIQAVNNAAVRLLNRRRFQVLGQDLAGVLGLDVEYLDTATRLHGAGYVERIGVRVKTVKALREVAVQPLVLRSANGEVLAVLCSLHPGSQDPALRATSLLDPVTGLPGAALGEALIEQELRRHAGGSGPLVAAVFLRLDDSGVAATRHGQVLYERLQNAVAERLHAVCDWPLDLARSAGGGFLMLLTQVNDRQEVEDIARRAHELLSRPFRIDDKELQLPVMVAVLPDLRVYHELVDVMADAREALERARHAPDQVLVAEERGQDRVALALALEAAIATDALDLRLEPVVDLRNEQACGMRARLRWAPEGMAMIDDAALRRLARRVHLEGPLNQWRLKQLSQIKHPKGWSVWLPVDLEELQSAGFVKVFPKAITQLPFKLYLELPDLAWLLPATHKIANDLAEAGFGLHAAQYSVGSRVVTHAAGLPPRSASLDAALVQSSGPAAEAAVRGIVATAQAQGASILAEGVRKQADLQRLRALGVSQACGEFVGRALSPLELGAWLQNDAHIKALFAGLPPLADDRGQRRSPQV